MVLSICLFQGICYYHLDYLIIIIINKNSINDYVERNETTVLVAGCGSSHMLIGIAITITTIIILIITVIKI